MLSTIFCHLFSAHAPFRRNSTSGLKYDWVTSIYYKSGEIVSIRHQFGVIFGEFWTAHVGLRYISTSANNSDVRFWLGDPDFIKKVCKFWRYERLKPFWPNFHCACGLKSDRWFGLGDIDFLSKCWNLGNTAENLGSFLAIFELRMRDGTIFLVPVINLMSDLHSATPISYKSVEIVAISARFKQFWGKF